MLARRWPTIRLGIFALLVTTTLGAWGYLLLRPPTNPEASLKSSFYPASLTLPDWPLVQSRPLQEKKSQGHLYLFQGKARLISAQAWLKHQGDGSVNRYLMVYGVMPPATVNLKPRKQEGTGYHALIYFNETAYLTACLNAIGQSTVTEAQFMQNLNTYGWDLSRFFGWLLGQQNLRDNRCLWTLLATPLTNPKDETLVRQTFEDLESFWSQWSSWWRAYLQSHP